MKKSSAYFFLPYRLHYCASLWRVSRMVLCDVLSWPHPTKHRSISHPESRHDALRSTWFFLLWSAFSDKYRDAGILVLCIFCGGLVAGRILSVVVDGTPSPLLPLYIALELSLVTACIWLLKRES